AALQLKLSQPALTVQIRKLESELGFALFSRSTRTVTLSPEGEKFHRLATEALGAQEALLAGARRIRAAEAEVLRIGAASYTAEIPERAALLDEAMEGCGIRMKVDTRRQASLLSALQ